MIRRPPAPRLRPRAKRTPRSFAVGTNTRTTAGGRLKRRSAPPIVQPVTTGAPTAATAGDHTTLADLVRIAVLDGTRLVPARAPLDAAVTSLVLADPGAPAEPGALVVCPGPPPEPLPE